MAKSELPIGVKILNVMSGHEGQVFKRHEIIQMVIKNYRDTNETSVIPSDYCYNMLNNGIHFDPENRLFEHLSRGVYKFLGPNIKYKGLVFWKGSEYGEWKDGKYRK